MTTITDNTMTRCRFRPYGPDGDRLWMPELRMGPRYPGWTCIPRAVFTSMPEPAVEPGYYSGPGKVVGYHDDYNGEVNRVRVRGDEYPKPSEPA